jgi:hypothetical protein
MRVFAIASVFVGLVVFTFLYFQKIEGRLLEALSDPRTIVVILVPFLPAAVLTFLAERARAKFVDFMQLQHGAPQADAPADTGKKKK